MPKMGDEDMKKIIIILLALVLTSGVVFAQAEVENFVKVALETGIVQKVELSNIAVTMYVSPAFYALNYDDKRATAAAFLKWARARKSNIDLVMLRDSRNNKAIGNYDPNLGLSLK